MYQVIIHESGTQAKVFDFPTLELANQAVEHHANEMSLTCNEDQDGFAYAHAGDNHYININAFIFQII